MAVSTFWAASMISGPIPSPGSKTRLAFKGSPGWEGCSGSASGSRVRVADPARGFGGLAMPSGLSEARRRRPEPRRTDNLIDSRGFPNGGIAWGIGSRTELIIDSNRSAAYRMRSGSGIDRSIRRRSNPSFWEAPQRGRLCRRSLRLRPTCAVAAVTDRR